MVFRKVVVIGDTKKYRNLVNKWTQESWEFLRFSRRFKGVCKIKLNFPVMMRKKILLHNNFFSFVQCFSKSNSAKWIRQRSIVAVLAVTFQLDPRNQSESSFVSTSFPWPFPSKRSWEQIVFYALCCDNGIVKLWHSWWILQCVSVWCLSSVQKLTS